jgi:hypothetical protein
MKYLITFSFLLFISSCANIKNARVIKGNYDYYQLDKAGSSTGRPIRTNNGDLILDESSAEAELAEVKSFSELRQRVDKNCKRSLKLASHYHQAVRYLKENNIQMSKAELEKSQLLCSSIDMISHYFYIEAYQAQVDGDYEKRNQKLQAFLSKSEGIFPKSFYQEDFVKTETIELYELYKEHARDVLKSDISLKLILTDDEKFNVARYNSYYKTLMPGFKNDSPGKFFIKPGFEWLYGLNISSGYQYKTDFGEFIPIVIVNSHFDLKHLIYRKQISQTPNRRHQTSLVFGVTEWKDVDFNYTSIRRAKDIKVSDEGFGNFVGYGGTFQLNNTHSFMYQARSVSEKHERIIKGTALIGWAIGEESVLQFGSLNNHVVIAWKTTSFYTTIDFTDRGLNSSVYTGFTF